MIVFIDFGVFSGMMKQTRILALLSGIGIFACTLMAHAQTVSDDLSVPNASLNLPSSLATFGKVDPKLRKATAIVNGDVITGTDVDQRLALIILANGGKVDEAEKDRLRVQVLRNLIDESLQIQEAKANDIIISNNEIDQSFVRVAQNFKRQPSKMSEYLREQGSSDKSIKRQVQGEMAWSRLLRRRVEPFVNVGDEEVKSIMDRLNATKGTKEFRVGEIYLSSTPENSAEVSANAKRIVDQLRQGGSFQAYARQFSEASTAAVGGDLGWIRPAQLPTELGQAIQELSIGQIAGPIAIAGGYSLIYLIDSRQVLVANPRDAVMSLRQLALSFPKTLTPTQAQARASEFAKATQEMQGCGAVDAVAKQFGSEVVDNDQVRVRDLPPPLQDMLLNLQVGQSTPPFGSQAEGVRVLVLCGRDDPEVAGGPSADAIEGQLRDERINRRAQIYLRDLRRDAVIDYR
jgi:peptidyl-prolyl cis-trans isomerase SurA